MKRYMKYLCIFFIVFIIVFQCFITVHADNIPKVINFIWLGRMIAPAHIVNIVKWAQQNPTYNFKIWVFSPTYLKIYGEIKRPRELLYEIFFDRALMNTWINKVKDDYIQLQQNAINCMLAKAGIVESNVKIVDTIADSNIFVTTGINMDCFTEALFLFEEPNYLLASDILRIEILNYYGGIYFDIDIAARTLPDEIPVPAENTQGFLAGKYILLMKIGFSNAALMSVYNGSGMATIRERLTRKLEEEIANNNMRLPNFSKSILATKTGNALIGNFIKDTIVDTSQHKFYFYNIEFGFDARASFSYGCEKEKDKKNLQDLCR